MSASSTSGFPSIHTITVPNGPTLTQSFTYDGVNRLLTAQENNGTSWRQTFTYDRCGNRSVDVSNTSSDFVGSNPLISSATNRITPRPGELYSYDTAGNLTRDGAGHVFSYDAENMQTKYDNTVGQYFYDGSQRRVKTVARSGTTVFVYDALGKLVAEYTSGSATGSGTSYLTSDGLGSPRIITGTNPASIVKARHDYLPFGEEIVGGIGGRSSTQGYVADAVRQKFTGQQRDTESGLDYFQARYYSSGMGRFTSADTVMGSITNPQTLNRYAYVLNNPLALVDPTGHISESQYDGTDDKLRQLREERRAREYEESQNWGTEGWWAGLVDSTLNNKGEDLNDEPAAGDANAEVTAVPSASGGQQNTKGKAPPAFKNHIPGPPPTAQSPAEAWSGLVEAVQSSLQGLSEEMSIQEGNKAGLIMNLDGTIHNHAGPGLFIPGHKWYPKDLKDKPCDGPCFRATPMPCNTWPNGCWFPALENPPEREEPTVRAPKNPAAIYYADPSKVP